MTKIAYLFPGQGAQYPGMIKDFFELSIKVQDLFALASEAANKNMEKLLFDAGQEELKETQNTQIAVTLANLAVREYLLEQGITSACSAGFSLGEYAALVDGGILTPKNAFALVIERGKAMEQAVTSSNQLKEGAGMVAVIGLSPQKVSSLLSSDTGVYPANFNSPHQVVISGTTNGLKKAIALCKEAGAKRTIPLKVSGPFHTPLMQEASESFAHFLAQTDFNDPIKPVVSNVTGDIISSGDQARKLCARQIIAPVEWIKTEKYLGQADLDFFIETGPGTVLSGLWKVIYPDKPFYSVGTVEKTKEFISLIE